MAKFNEKRLFVLNNPYAPRLCPALAAEIGLNESIILLQLEFLIVTLGTHRDGRRWYRWSVRDINQRFPFLSIATINRTVQSLEFQGLIYTTRRFNEKKYDKTRWFALNLERASELKSIMLAQLPEATAQNETARQKPTTQHEMRSAQNETRSAQHETAIHENNSENTTKTHIQTQASPSPRVGVSNSRISPAHKSRHSIPVLEEYFTWKKRNGANLNPEAVARKRAQDALEDDLVDAWLVEKNNLKPDINQCPGCQGIGFVYVDPRDYGKGVRRCTHPKLKANAA